MSGKVSAEMIHYTVLFLFFILVIFHKGLTAAVVETQQTVMAAAGEDSSLSCQLMETKDVLQVTWQKVLPDQEKNVATINKYFGEKVIPDFRDRLKFIDAGRQSCSIVIRNVTEEDEGCYLCLFNTYSDGALTGRTCLQLYELDDPVLHVRESNSPEESVVSCSATGRPAPTVTLTVTPQHLNVSHYDTVRVTNTNATVTVTATAVLSGFYGNSIQVGCAARVLSGPQKEVMMMIPADEFDEESVSKNSSRSTVAAWTATVTWLCVVAAVVMLYLKAKEAKKPETEPNLPVAPSAAAEQNHRDTERNEIPESTTEDTNESEAAKETVTPRTTKSEVRQRTPPEKNKPSDKENSSSTSSAS